MRHVSDLSIHEVHCTSPTSATQFKRQQRQATAYLLSLLMGDVSLDAHARIDPGLLSPCAWVRWVFCPFRERHCQAINDLVPVRAASDQASLDRIWAHEGRCIDGCCHLQQTARHLAIVSVQTCTNVDSHPGLMLIRSTVIHLQQLLRFPLFRHAPPVIRPLSIASGHMRGDASMAAVTCNSH